MFFHWPTAAQASLFLITVLFASTSTAQSRSQNLDTFSQDTLLVKFKPGTSGQIQSLAHRSANASHERTLAGTAIQLLKIPPGSVDQTLAAYRKNPNVEYAEKNYRRIIYFPTTLEGSETIGALNFDNFNEQWNLHNTGQEFGLTLNFNGNLLYPSYEGAPDADIDAPEAWAISEGDSSITIAVLDTGVDCNHLDLQGKCDAGSTSFVTESGKSDTDEDVIGHGTHIAGIAAAITNNSIGIAGVGWNTSIAALKTCWEDYSNIQFGVVQGVCDDDDVIEAIQYAQQQGYQIITLSFAGSVDSSALQDAIDTAWGNGMIFVAAAGNIYSDDVLYPAGYNNVISVGASDHQDNLSAFSNHGVAASLLAPGTNIVSTVPGLFCGQAEGEQSDCYDTKSGTSMAAPHVAGLAALMLAEYPGVTNVEVRDTLFDSADHTGALGQNMLAWSAHGRINMHSALSEDPRGSVVPQPSSAEVQSAPTLSTLNAGRGDKKGRAVVTIVDDLGNTLSEVAVHGVFTGSYNEEITLFTESGGSAEFTTDATARGGISFEFCVVGVDSALPFNSDPTNDCFTF